jgi:glycine cleavage system H protein
MEPIVSTLQMVGLFVAGLIGRFAVLLLVIAVVGLPIYLVVEAVRGVAGLRERRRGLGHVAGMLWSRGVYYAAGHTWVKPARRHGLRVGIDDLAQRLLGQGKVVGLPTPGTALREGDVAVVVTCGDKRAEIRSPVDGVVTGVNRAVTRDVSLIHRAPYTAGWLFAVKPSSPAYRGFLRGEAARAWLGHEGGRFARMVEASVGLAAADGGELIAPTPTLLTDTQWSALTRTFLLTGRAPRVTAGTASSDEPAAAP